MSKIAILGCGNIGRAVAEGLVKGNFIENSQLTVTRRELSSLSDLEEKGVKITTDNTLAVRESQYIIIAVKPYKVEEILNEIKAALTEDHILVSLASGVSINKLKEVVDLKIPYFRAMPNTAAEIGESLTCVCAEGEGDEQKKTVEAIFSSIGETIVIDEGLMEAATILGACGIAYALRFVRAMIQGGIQIGFDADTASLITTQTVKGAARLLQEKNTHPEAEIDKVTTPKGCTITGLNEMEHQGFSASLIQGINRSFEKIEKT